ncbi:hypothetical protein [Bacteroides fragilis]|jgi:hypothetical protein|uniref:hypothetical protein n=1 Tax=Bacteroides fragilis TaxID=817 RepID=UPI00370432E1|nr:hypothetical protein [Bacteroides fragilis]
MNLQMETMSDKNEMSQDNGAHCCHCHEGECCCQKEGGECECHCQQYETQYPELFCIEMEPDNFNDWD